jgi:epoxyqueuosine reductase
MMELEKELERLGYRAKILPIDCLQKLRQDAEALKSADLNNDYAKEIVNCYYDFSLPNTGFELRSMIIVVSKSPAARVAFDTPNGRLQFLIPPGYIDMTKKHLIIEKELNALLDPDGHHAVCTPCLPQKLLAVRSGLSRYGRNNITYTEGFGSFTRISTFYSDLPCEDADWQSVRRMDCCENCAACLHSCPNGAIVEDDNLIITDRCLTHFNEREAERFPDWIDPAAHNALVGCFKCQACCPQNKPFLGDIVEPVAFTEQETELLLSGIKKDALPDALHDKLETLDMFEYFGCIARNLKLLIKNK